MDQGKFWIVTDFDVTRNYDTELPAFWTSKDICFAKGQLEKAGSTGRLHWQFVVAYNRKKRLHSVKITLGNGVHAELTRSAAAHEYCCKDDTSQGRRFEFGQLPLRRNARTDWELIREQARAGRLDEIQANVYVCHYNSLKRIAMDNMIAAPLEKDVNVYWGETGVGKSRRAWEEAGMDAYPKAPTTKFWDGYQGQENVVIDEFTGQIEVIIIQHVTVD